MDAVELLHYTAFASQPEGGNPAGVVLLQAPLADARMQSLAAEAGHSETAFLIARGGGRFEVRYFSPQAEVPFCGHATVASGVALAERGHTGRLLFHTRAGEVAVDTRRDPVGWRAELTSVEPQVYEADDALVDAALQALHWRRDELDPVLPPRIAYAGARHLVLAAATRARLAALDYDFDALTGLMHAHDLTTLALVWQESPTCFHARNPFPVGGVVEDPATGAAAAAFGGYLRALQRVTPPARVTVLQGEDMGRPGVITVDIGAEGGIRVSGHAVRLRVPVDA